MKKVKKQKQKTQKLGCESCLNNTGGKPKGCQSNGVCTSGGCAKMPSYDWLKGIPVGSALQNQYAEVRFKNTRKAYFRNTHGFHLSTGDLVVVSTDSNYDIGSISLSGVLANLQFKKQAEGSKKKQERIIRRATKQDLALWAKAKAREGDTKRRARFLALSTGLRMKITDVEFAADNKKATFYYTADGRVDFRELVKKYASEFKIRVDMKQIGARQEAGMVGGIGSCGRELCCATWLKDFRSVSIGSLRYQQLSINSEKMAGQCGKLKCCLNYELDSYMEAIKEFPSPKLTLKTKKGIAYHFKSDILGKNISYFYKDSKDFTPITLPLHAVNHIIQLNKKGVVPDDLVAPMDTINRPAYQQVVGQDDLTRFDQRIRKKKKKRKIKKQ